MPLHMRLPKLRGFKNPFRVEYQVVNVDALAKLFPQGATVDHNTVVELVGEFDKETFGESTLDVDQLKVVAK